MPHCRRRQRACRCPVGTARLTSPDTTARALACRATPLPSARWPEDWSSVSCWISIGPTSIIRLRSRSICGTPSDRRPRVTSPHPGPFAPTVPNHAHENLSQVQSHLRHRTCRNGESACGSLPEGNPKEIRGSNGGAASVLPSAGREATGLVLRDAGGRGGEGADRLRRLTSERSA